MKFADLLGSFDLATLAAVGVLALYCLFALSIFIYRLSNLRSFEAQERSCLAGLLREQGLAFESYFKPARGEKNRLNTMYLQAQQLLSEGLTWLSIIATTSPFIGLFGTVVSIYFTLISLQSGAGDIARIASPIGHALIATAAGIISAVLAYTFSLIIRHKCTDCLAILESQLEILLDAADELSSAANREALAQQIATCLQANQSAARTQDAAAKASFTATATSARSQDFAPLSAERSSRHTAGR